MFLTWSASRPEQYISTIGGPKSWNKSFYSKRKEERVKTSDDRDNWWAFDEVGVHGFFLQPPPCAPHLAESSSIISIIWCFHPFFLSFAVEALVSVLIAIPTPATLCMKEERSELWSIISYERRLKRTCVSYYLPSLISLPNCANESHSANLQLWKLWLNGRSVASAIRKYLALRSPYLKKQIRYDLQSTLRNSTTNELCDKVKSRGGMGCSKLVQCLTKVTMEVN